MTDDLRAGILAQLPPDTFFFDWLVCDFDQHANGDHHAYVDEVDETEGTPPRAVWIAWTQEAEGTEEGAPQARVSVLEICPSQSPSGETACWLPNDHRTGHSWERYE
ncbi:hypothetical protein ACFVT5_27990 [Streptomyces sp. NPDC058001]|uniref:hypothetical protein n=1 Tax=Streptomyces sp. NPDC058001 TaxID=3346300 RepID=UPI0036EEBF89